MELPDEIIVEIISKCQQTDIWKWKLVNKHWYHLLKTNIKPNKLNDRSDVYQAAANNAIIDLIHSRNNPILDYVFTASCGVCSRGDMEMAQLCLDLGLMEWKFGLGILGENGFLEIIKLMLEKFPECSPYLALHGGCKGGKLNVVEYILSQNNFRLHNAFNVACEHGKVNVLEYLLSLNKISNYEYESGILEGILHNKFEVVKYLLEHCNFELHTECILKNITPFTKLEIAEYLKTKLTTL